MKIKLQTGDLKMGEQIAQLPGSTKTYVGQGNASLKDLNKTPIGHSKIDSYWVDASYDSRPVGATDFTLRLTSLPFFIDWFPTSGVCNQLTVPFPGASLSKPDVPDGYVFVVRHVSGSIAGSITAGILSEPAQFAGTMSVLLNNSQVPSAKGIPFNWTATPVEQFFIADAGDIITVEFQAEPLTQLYNPYPNQGFMAVDIYGNLLAKTGIPTQFEVTNKR